MRTSPAHAHDPCDFDENRRCFEAENEDEDKDERWWRRRWWKKQNPSIVEEEEVEEEEEEEEEDASDSSSEEDEDEAGGKKEDSLEETVIEDLQWCVSNALELQKEKSLETREREQLLALAESAISDSAIRRLSRNAGMTRCASAQGVRLIRKCLFAKLCQLIRDSVVYAQHLDDNVIKSRHLEMAVKLETGHRLYSDNRCFNSEELKLSHDPCLSEAKILTAPMYSGSIASEVGLREVWWHHCSGQASEMTTMIREKKFRKLVKQTACSMFSNDLSFRLRAIKDLQQLAEDYAVHLIEDALLLAIHAKRTLVLPMDLQLAIRIRCDLDKLRSNFAHGLWGGHDNDCV
jgi:histone H3/histone H3-like centromeric protein A